jgi:hypothetical protein
VQDDGYACLGDLPSRFRTGEPAADYVYWMYCCHDATT